MTYSPFRHIRIRRSMPRFFDFCFLILGAFLFTSPTQLPVLFFAYAIVLWEIISFFTRFYFFESHSRIVLKLFRIVSQFLSFSIALFAYIGIFKTPELSRIQIGNYFLYCAATIITVKFLWFFLMIRHNRIIKQKPQQSTLVGDPSITNELVEILERRTDFGFAVNQQIQSSDMETTISKIDPIQTQIVFCAYSGFSNSDIITLQKFCHKHFIQLKLIADLDLFLNQRTTSEYIDYLPIISIQDTPLEKESNRYLKRLMDIVISSLVILGILSWLYPVLWVIIRTTSRGPAIFSQKRNGLNNHVFQCYKFRSMRSNQSASQAIKNDDRITPIGRIIRKTSVDELPQFFNVLFGDMSIVGPRPHMEEHNKIFASKVNEFSFRHMVKPGITGLAQTKGCRGEIKTDKDIVNRIKYDIFYIKNWSLLLDIKIILQTGLLVIIGDKKAY